MSAAQQDSSSRRAKWPLLRLALLLSLFVGLTGLGVWWASPDWAALSLAWQRFTDLPAWMHTALAAMAIGLVFAEMLRLAVMGRALGVRVGFMAALNATVANNFFSWITPGSALGEPAAAYMLGKRGIPWDAAALIAFGKLALSFVFIFGVAGILVGLGFGPAIPVWILAPFAVVAAIVGLLCTLLIAGSLLPTLTTSIIGRIENRLGRSWLFGNGRRARALHAVAHHARNATERLSSFRRRGAAFWIVILASHAIYYVVFIGILLLLAHGFDTASTSGTAISGVVYQAFVYAAPTPGGSGVGEASAELFFGDLFPAGGAVAVVVLFRSLTFYFHVVLGLVYLPLVGGLGGFLRRDDDAGGARDQGADQVVDEDQAGA